MATTSTTSQPQAKRGDKTSASGAREETKSSRKKPAVDKNQENGKVVSMPIVPLGTMSSSAALSCFIGDGKPRISVLPRFPSEIVQMIAANLDMPALGSFRLVCKELEGKILHYFTSAYFRELKIIPSRYALKGLVTMSESRLAKSTRTVTFSPPPNDQGLVEFNEDVPEAGPVVEKITNAMLSYAEENRTMRAFGEDSTLLKAAFKNLKAVTKIKLAEFPDCGCGLCALTHSYGKSHFRNTICGGVACFSPIGLDSSQSFARLLHITLDAAQAVGLRLESIDAQLTRLPEGYYEECQKTGFGMYPLTFPSAPLEEKPSDSAFAYLSNLKLFLGHHHDMCNSDRRQRFIRRFTDFLERALMLRTLALTIQQIHGTMSCLEGITSSPVLRKIKQLELCNLEFDISSFASIIRPIGSTLQSLKLYNIAMSDGDWVGMLEILRDYMKKLTEVELEALDGYPSPISYKGHTIHDFFETTIYQWVEDRERLATASWLASELDSDASI